MVLISIGPLAACAPGRRGRNGDRGTQSARALRDAELMVEIRRVYDANFIA
jgi:hypothetical protein